MRGSPLAPLHDSAAFVALHREAMQGSEVSEPPTAWSTCS